MDFDIKGTMGVTDDDADYLRALDDVETVMPAKVTDVIMAGSNGTSYATRLYGIPLEQRGTKSFLNDFVLLEGRLPKTSSEVLLCSTNRFTQNHKVGETFTISEENTDYEDRADTYAVETYTTVGIIRCPQYMTVETEPCSVGTGKLELILYTFESCYSLDVYTDLFLTVRGATDINSFQSDYTDLMERIGDNLETIGKERSVIRFVTVKEDAQQEIDDAQVDYNDAKSDAEADLADARKKLDDAQVELADAKDELETNQKKYDYAHYQYYKQKNAFEKDIQSKRADASAALNAGMITQAQYDGMIQQIDEGEKTGQAEFKKNHRKLADAKVKLADGADKLADAEQELADAEQEYADAEEDLKRELRDAQQKIDDAQKELDDLDEPEWMLLDRSDTVSYASYKNNTEKIDAIAKVFPIFLFLVAALVALTTMTRMVEEERSQIGTLKALGYSDGNILRYYLSYSISASLFGCIIGVVVGFKLLPSVISQAYSMLYTIPPIITVFRWGTALTIAPIAVCCTTLATLWACITSLREKPSLLMLPRVPQAGKRIFLERIPFIWKMLKFTQKVTCRNIFRYKKRLYMTVIGIAGCTALLLTGFGLRDSINDIVEKQFGALYIFDMTVFLKDGDVLKSNSEIADYFNTSDEIESYAAIHVEDGRVLSGGKSEKTNIYVPQVTDELKKHIRLRTRDAHADVPFHDDSVVLTEKMCEQLNLSIGDAITLEDDAGQQVELTVTGITENYVTSYVFMSDALYQKLFHTFPEYDSLIVSVANIDSATEESISKKLLAFDDITLVQFNSSIQDSFNNLIGNINYIVYVLILAAGALAMIVLYNLTNINISERKKELATIKVLGFYEPEVAKYIYRETTFLSILGTLVGFAFGVWLHAFVIKTAEMDAIMFGRTLYVRSFLLAAAVTLLFTLLVDLIMLPKIRKINMVESMKASD